MLLICLLIFGKIDSFTKFKDVFDSNWSNTNTSISFTIHFESEKARLHRRPVQWWSSREARSGNVG